MDITQTIIDDFRGVYSPLSDVNKFPDELLSEALEEADAETGGHGWGVYENVGQNFKRRGMFIYAMHWIVSTYPNGVSGALTGGSKFAVSSKTVGDESVTYNNGNLSNAGVGDSWLASSSFGQQFIRLRRRAGRGALAV